MPLFKRKITYFYEHNKGSVGNTAGFLKMEIRGEKVKIIINIQEPPEHTEQLPDLYFYHEAGDHLSAVKVGTVERMNGMLIFHQRTEWQNIFGTNRDLYTFDGVAVVYHAKHYYIGDFLDKNRVEFPLKLKENWYEEVGTDEIAQVISAVSHLRKEQGDRDENNASKEEAPFQEGETREEGQGNGIKREEQDQSDGIKEKEQSKRDGIISFDQTVQKEDNLSHQNTFFSNCENCPYQKKRMMQESQEHAFEHMLAEYPKLPMYGVGELMECVRIHPKDIGRLDMRNWKLGVNSFLTHGFYTYQYLMLGKMIFENGRTQPILGVPGVYSSREKYVANMFGFEQFVPVKKTGTKTGEFGYWIVELV